MTTFRDSCEQEQFLNDLPKVKAQDIRYMAFQGGGGKGVGYLGTIEALKELGVLPLSNGQIKGIAGTSAGAITAFLLSIGMTPEAMKALFTEKNDDKLTEFQQFFERSPRVGVYNAVKWDQNRTQIGFSVDRKWLNKKKLNKKIKEKKGNKPLVTQFYDDIEEAEKEGRKQYRKVRLAAKGASLLTGNVGLVGSNTRILVEFLMSSGYKIMAEKMFKGYEKFIRQIKTRGPFDKLIESLVKKISERENTYKYLYNLLFDRGLFSGYYPRKLFTRLLEEDNENKIFNTKGVVTFRDLFGVTGIKFVVTGSNLTKKTIKYFSVDYTPDFPVVDAVVISMAMPGVFKPIYVNTVVHKGKSVDYNNEYTGLYTDGGMTVNLPLTIFDYEDEEASRDKNLLELRKDIVAFGVLDGFDPRDSPKDLFWDQNFKKYLSYLVKEKDLEKFDTIIHVDDYLKEYMPNYCDPTAKFPSDFDPENGLITLFPLFGDLFSTFLDPHGNYKRFRVLSERRQFVPLYAYDITSIDFSPQENLREFVIERAKIRTKEYFES